MDMDHAAELIEKGGTLVYPTETLYALGCAATDAAACRRVAAIKGRPAGKPFPLIVADLDGLRAFAAAVPPDLLRLAAAFWPGPLSILVRMKDEICPLAHDAEGFSSVRASPHPVARELCRRTGGALVATSANKSGGIATADPAALDPEVLAASDGALLLPPRPAGGAPSTVVRLLGGGELAILRAGALPISALKELFRIAAPA